MEQKKDARQSLSDLGEFGLIDHLTGKIKLKHTSSVKGVGDDAAVLNFAGKTQVLTTDLLIEGIHFNLMYTPLKHLGYKSVIVNLSDVLAMNAQPRQITISIAVSNRFTLEAIEELYTGIHKACEIYNVDIVGGDTTSSTRGLIISITATGEAENQEIVYRNGAKPNDLICVTGDLGAAYMGLQLLEREKEVFKVNPHSQPDLSSYAYIVERQLKPEARKDIIRTLKKIDVQPTAMMDISDGLSSELIHICKNSNTGCKIFEEKIPYHNEMIKMCEELSIEPATAALNGGEDYELLFTVSLSNYEKVKELPGISLIGHITDKKEGMVITGKNGESVQLKAQGWNAL